MKLRFPTIRTIPGSFQFSIAALTTLSIVLLGGFWIFTEYQNFEEDTAKQKEEYIQKQKQLVRYETEKVMEYIHISRQFMINDFKEDLQERVRQACNIAANLYEKNKNQLSKKQILELIREALRPIRFHGGSGHFFIVNTKGDEILYPLAPEKEGQNFLYLKDAKENYVVQQEIEIALGQGEGFVEGEWPNPQLENNATSNSINFVKYFQPLNIIIGSGEFLTEVEKILQKKIIKHIEQVRYGEKGYIFLNTYDGKAIIIRSDKYKTGDNVWDVTDPYGVKVVQEERKAVENPEGSYITYHWNEPDSDHPVPKISFIMGIPEWKWMMGAWYNMDEINKVIANQRHTLYQRVKNQIIQVLVILVLTHLLIILITRWIAHSTRTNSKTFIRMLGEAIRHNLKIDIEKLHFLEFQQMAKTANLIIEEKSEAQKALKISEDRFKNLFEIAPLMIFALDSKGKIVLWNQECEKRLKLNKSDIRDQDKPLRNLFKDEKSLPDLEKNLMKPNHKFQEYSLITAHGQSHQQVWSSFQSTEELIIAVGYDITQQKETMDNLERTARQLEEANQTKDKFLSIIAHDLKNPFNALLGFSAILKDEYDELSEDLRKDYIGEMHRSAENTLLLLENLLEWARSQSDRIDYYPQVHSLYETVENCRMLLGQQAAKKEIRLENRISENAVIYADPNMILTVIRNLISNAIKFTRNGGEVIIEQKSDGKDIVLMVKDNGIGMSEKVVSNLFKIEHKYQTVGTNHESGTGLGLLICKEFVEKNNGKIWVESTPEEGSLFYIQLPINNQVNNDLKS